MHLIFQYSTLEEWERVALKLMYINVTDESFVNTHNSFKKIKDKKQLEIYKLKSGCIGQKSSPILLLDDEFEVYKCPCQFDHESFFFLVQAYRLYQQGVLPTAQNLIDENNYFIEAFNIFQDVDNTRAEEDRRKMEKKVNG